jgi:hypothetical protein
MTSNRSKCVATDTNSHGLIDRFMTGAVVRSNFSRGVWKDKIYPMTIFVGDITWSVLNKKKSIDTLSETFNLPQSHFWSFLVQFKNIWIFRLIRIEIITLSHHRTLFVVSHHDNATPSQASHSTGESTLWMEWIMCFLLLSRSGASLTKNERCLSLDRAWFKHLTSLTQEDRHFSLGVVLSERYVFQS